MKVEAAGYCVTVSSYFTLKPSMRGITRCALRQIIFAAIAEFLASVVALTTQVSVVLCKATIRADTYECTYCTTVINILWMCAVHHARWLYGNERDDRRLDTAQASQSYMQPKFGESTDNTECLLCERRIRGRTQ